MKITVEKAALSHLEEIGRLYDTLCDQLRSGRNYPGWASLMLSLWFIGSLVLIALGIIGEYVSKIYLEVKHRPRYFVERRTPRRPNNP